MMEKERLRRGIGTEVVLGSEFDSWMILGEKVDALFTSSRGNAPLYSHGFATSLGPIIIYIIASPSLTKTWSTVL